MSLQCDNLSGELQDQWSSSSYFFLIMNEYDQTFNPNILIGHYDLISWFIDFALYLNTEWVYDHISVIKVLLSDVDISCSFPLFCNFVFGEFAYFIYSSARS